MDFLRKAAKVQACRWFCFPCVCVCVVFFSGRREWALAERQKLLFASAVIDCFYCLSVWFYPPILL